MSADNPASCALGGFKEGASALRICRHCMATSTDMRLKVNNRLTITSFIMLAHALSLWKMNSI